MKFLDLFEPIQKGDFALTDEAVYKSIQYNESFVPLWGGQKEHVEGERFVSEKGRTKKNKPITIFNGTGIIISLDGSAGKMTFVKNNKFALNHHAGFFTVKRSSKPLIDPQFFVLFYDRQLEEASVSEGSKTLTTRQLYSMDFDIPPYDTQKQIMLKAKPVLEKKKLIEQVMGRITNIRDRILSHEYTKYQATEVPISEIVDCLSGNSGLTEKTIYQNSPLDGLRYTVLSSSTKEETRLGEIPMSQIKGKPLKVFENKEGILVIRNGKAGTTFFLEKGKYTINDHAYILSLKENTNYEVSLKWLMVQYRKDFFEYSSSSDNGTWNKTGFFKNMKVDLPQIDEQKKVLEVYEKLEQLEKNIIDLKNGIESLFTKQISVV